MHFFRGGLVKATGQNITWSYKAELCFGRHVGVELTTRSFDVVMNAKSQVTFSSYLGYLQNPFLDRSYFFCLSPYNLCYHFQEMREEAALPFFCPVAYLWYHLSREWGQRENVLALCPPAGRSSSHAQCPHPTRCVS